MRTWNLVYSSDGFFIQVFLAAPFRFRAYQGVVEWLAHHFPLSVLPTLPVPFLHKDEEFCEQKNYHWHNFWKWHGWSVGQLLCNTLEERASLDLFKQEHVVKCISITTQELDELCLRDKKSRVFREDNVRSLQAYLNCAHCMYNSSSKTKQTLNK